jgi:hypothetical protein
MKYILFAFAVMMFIGCAANSNSYRGSVPPFNSSESDGGHHHDHH